MSSLIDVSTTSAEIGTNGHETAGIIHFDATLRRKEKMKRTALEEQARGQNHDPSSHDSPGNGAAASAPASRNGGVASSNGGTSSHYAATAAAVSKPQPPVPVAAEPSQASAAPAPAGSPVETKSAPASATVAIADLSRSELEEFLVNFVVEQTGYPSEMVELDADLEADLGIDSIKKAQMFGEMAENLDVQIQITEDMSLDDFPTLRHVLDFLDGAPAKGSIATPPAEIPAATEKSSTAEKAAAPELSAPAGAASPTATSATDGVSVADTPSTPSMTTLGPEDLESFLVNFVVEQTGYPPEMVELDADLEADLGIDSIKKAQMFGEMAENLDVQIQITEDMSLDDFPTLRHVLDFLAQAPVQVRIAADPPSSSAAAPANRAAEAATSTPAYDSAAAPSVPPTSPPSSPTAAPSPPPTETSPPSAATAATATLGPEDLESFLVNFVVEQTGYPPEMVELDADLEADLGIDSIKKAQMFGEMAENLDVQIQITEDMSLDDFPTLRHVLDFLNKASSGVSVREAPAVRSS